MCYGEAANICGEEYKKEGEENVFYVAVVRNKESDREMHSVFFATHIPSQSRSAPLLPDLPHTTRALFTGHRQVGRWFGFRRGRWWRCPQVKL